jgi:hypothetical protein
MLQRRSERRELESALDERLGNHERRIGDGLAADRHPLLLEKVADESSAP